MKIIPARPEDSRLIGKSVVDAIGIEIAESLAGDKHSVDDVVDMFAMLAEREDSQYSYTNTLVAIDDDGKPVGVCIGYDGARLHELRKAFFFFFSSCLGLCLEGVEDECDADEFYLDTIAVLPEYRGQGIAGALLRASIERAAKCGKPAGLLVDPINPNARRLYERVGFTKVGDRPFVHVMMDHMQYLG